MAPKEANVRARIHHLGFWQCVGISGLICLVGIGSRISQSSLETAAGNTSDYVPWGLYIVMYLFFVGIGVGALMLSAVTIALDVQALKVMVRPGLILTLTSLATAGLFIVADLGRPKLVWLMIINANISSPLVWDFLAISTTFVLTAFLLVVDMKSVSKTMRVNAAWMVLVSGIGLRMISSWLFGLQVARPYWHSALIGPKVLVSAVSAGLAVFALTGFALRRWRWLKCNDALFERLASWVVVMLGTDLFLRLSETVVKLYGKTESELLLFKELMSGRLSALFWLEILFCFVVPLELLFFHRRTKVLVWAAGSVVIGMFLKLFNMLRIGYVYGASGLPFGVFSPQFADKPGDYDAVYTSLACGYHVPRLYIPGTVEIGVAVGIVAFFSLASLIAMRRFSSRSAEGVSA